MVVRKVHKNCGKFRSIEIKLNGVAESHYAILDDYERTTNIEAYSSDSFHFLCRNYLPALSAGILVLTMYSKLAVDELN